jgi:hypothetical protein
MTSLHDFSNKLEVEAWLYKLQKRVHSAASDKVYQLLAHGRWFSPGTPASSTTKTGRHDIAEILLKVALSTNNSKFMLIYPPHVYIFVIDIDLQVL